MVDAVISFVVGRLGDLLIEQVVSLRGVKDDVVWLRSQLQNMLCFLKDAEELGFLKDAEEKPDVNNRMRKWITDIRDVAYDAEDIVDKFILKVEVGAPKKMGLKDCFEKYFCICSKHTCLNQQANFYCIGLEINTLKTKLTQIEQSRITFGIRSIDDARERFDHMNRSEKLLRRERSCKDNEYVVGFKDDAEKLTSELFKDVKDRYMISIVGPGGLGKTTMARKLYNTLICKEKFDCCAWLSVSTDYDIQDLLRSTIKSFKSLSTKGELEFLEKMKHEDLERHLCDYVKGRRYLLVLDDVWDKKAWPSLMRAFPDDNNGSRVIMTTRNKVVAKASNERTYVHELPFLNDEESWELFCSKAFPNYDNEVGDEKSRCPPSLENLAREMACKCRGLPLAIVVLGGLLRRKDPDKWPNFKEHMWRHVREDDAHCVPVQHILALSFNDLPYRLKSCFLYLGLFPEDFEIDAEKLCRLWVAEGFIKLGKESFEEEEEEAEAEAEAEAYLRELIDRSLIQIVKISWKKIMTCRVHDLLRDFAIEKSKELNFLQIYGRRLAPNSRRLAFNGGLERFVSLDISDMHLRTLLFFNLENEDSKTAQLQSLCRELRLLRVLDLEHRLSRGYKQKKKQRLHDEIGKLIHLRYLGLCSVHINPLSQFIGSLHALQTLELNTYPYNDPIQLPNEICEAKQLRHLIGLFKWPFRVDNMKNLQTLKKVIVEDQMAFNPKDMINLHELHVYYVRRNGKGCTLDSIGGLRCLQSLELEVSVHESNQRPEVDLHPLSHCQALLQLRLICGRTKLISADWNFPNLKYLCLFLNGVTEDPMPMLEKLPKLTVLVLASYHGNKLFCAAGGFPQLEFLQLAYCDVDGFQLEGRAMPMLKGFSQLDGNCESLPDRLRSIPALDPPLNPREWAY